MSDHGSLISNYSKEIPSNFRDIGNYDFNVLMRVLQMIWEFKPTRNWLDIINAKKHLRSFLIGSQDGKYSGYFKSFTTDLKFIEFVSRPLPD